MKKFLAMGALAMALAVLSTPQAPAWLNVKFNAGLNYGWQSGGNNLLWGAYRNGQPPGPDGCGGAPAYVPPAPMPLPVPPPCSHQDQGSAVNNTTPTQDIPPAASNAPAPVQGSSYSHQAWYSQMVNYHYSNPTRYNYGYYGYYR